MARDLAIRIHVDTTTAQAQLGRTEKGLDDVAAAAKRADTSSKSFDVTVDKLSGGSLTKLTGLAGGVAGGLIAMFGAEVLRGASQFAMEILQDADALTKLRDKTGITAEGLQTLRGIAEQSGNTLEQLTGAISFLQNRLAEGDKSAVGALQRMGLSLDAIRAMKPDEQFYAIARGVAAMESPLERTRASWDLFGRGGAEIIPTLIADVDGLRRKIVVMSEESIDSADRLGDAWQLMSSNLKTGIVNNILPAVEHLLGRLGLVNNFADRLAAGSKLPTVGSPGGLLPTPLAVPGLPSVEAMRESDRALERLVQRNRELIRESEKARKAQEAFLASVRNLASSTVGLKAPFSEIGILFAANAGRGEAFRNVLEGLNEDGTLAAEAIQNLDIRLQSLGGKGGDGFDAALEAGRSFGQFLREDLGSIVVGAFQGGGSVFKSVGASIGDFMTGPNGIIGKAIKSIGGSLGKVLGGIAGPLGGILGGLAGSGVSKLFGKLFGTEQKEVNRVRQSFVDAAGGLDQLNRRAHTAGVTLDSLLDARKVKTYEQAVKDLTEAFEFQDKAMQFLDDTVKKYGFSIEELGPAFARQELDKRAQLLFKEFQALTAAGIGVDTVLGKMKDSVVEFVQQSLATGTEIPAAMAPMIQRLQEMGLLLDVNGNVIGNLEEAGVKFAMSMSEGFTALIDEVRKLTDAIARGLGLAIQNIPAIQVPVSMGDFEQPEIIPMAKGGMGRVLRPTLFYSKGNEDFAFSGEGRRFGGGSGGGGTAIVQIEGRTLMEVMVPHLPGAVKQFKLSR